MFNAPAVGIVTTFTNRSDKTQMLVRGQCYIVYLVAFTGTSKMFPQTEITHE